jgi:diaminopimelate epimerase|tara:strand:+ start:2402 stop:2674 length:273 start_codon:yes stop_codon:yes gene_type:complete
MRESKDLFGPEFIRSLLLMLEQTDYKQYMDLSYYVLMQSPHVIIKRADPIEMKEKGIDTLIKYFEEKEEFEKCANLQKLKLMLSLGDHKD